MEKDVESLVASIEKSLNNYKSIIEDKNNPSELLKNDIENKLKKYEEKNNKDAQELINFINEKVKEN